jgi:hypothetical protein
LTQDISPAAGQILLDLTLEKWQKLNDELTEFIRKNDYRFSKEGMGAERDSWKRAAAALVGNRQNTDMQL